jgi:hypothetical protein
MAGLLFLTQGEMNYDTDVKPAEGKASLIE